MFPLALSWTLVSPPRVAVVLVPSSVACDQAPKLALSALPVIRRVSNEPVVGVPLTVPVVVAVAVTLASLPCIAICCIALRTTTLASIPTDKRLPEPPVKVLLVPDEKLTSSALPVAITALSPPLTATDPFELPLLKIDRLPLLTLVVICDQP